VSQENVQGRRLARTHALYYAATGIWPPLDIESFERITGPKVERWLVKTIGALVTAVGASLAVAARDDPGRAETVILATASAAAPGAFRAGLAPQRTDTPRYPPAPAGPRAPAGG